MKAAFATLGCRVNKYETEAMIEKFKREGYEVVDFQDYADVYVINTCTVTSMGDKKSRQMISRAKRENKDAVIAVVGCYSQIKPEEVSLIQGVDVVLGTRNKGDVVYYVNRAREENKKIVEVSDVLKNKIFEELNVEEYEDRTRAFVKIQDGCNRFCSYCLIPYARGAVCSKDPSKVLEEVKKLAEHGFKEVVLTGIHIASYGNDLQNTSLMEILKEIDEVQGIERIRIGSIDPQFFQDGIIEEISKLKKFCPHFHLSLQSGCDETLKRMNRRYTTAEYKDITEKLRSKIKDVSITTDIITGFPGETEMEFLASYNYLNDLELSKMHIFKFSPREGTKAYLMKDDVTPKVKDERSKKLIQLDLELERKFRHKYIGRDMDVLYEKKVDAEKNLYEGYTGNYIKVVSESKEDISGRIIRTKISDESSEYLIGICEKNINF
ncbi:MAG: tRNA (N(6)-L-threonylcarbamoyladenosine(37)-C(2))-methylthiotransferase MtaB [Solirubrobacterales bacterium]